MSTADKISLRDGHSSDKSLASVVGAVLERTRHRAQPSFRPVNGTSAFGSAHRELGTILTSGRLTVQRTETGISFAIGRRHSYTFDRKISKDSAI